MTTHQERLLNLLEEYDRVEEQKKVTAKDYGEDIKALKKQIKDVRAMIKNGDKSRDN